MSLLTEKETTIEVQAYKEKYPEPELEAIEVLEWLSGCELYDVVTPQQRHDIASSLQDKARLIRQVIG